jgi:hypothetical protein
MLVEKSSEAGEVVWPGAMSVTDQRNCQIGVFHCAGRSANRNQRFLESVDSPKIINTRMQWQRKCRLEVFSVTDGRVGREWRYSFSDGASRETKPKNDSHSLRGSGVIQPTLGPVFAT